MRVYGWLRGVVAAVLMPMMLVQQSAAWGRDGHKMINRLAAEALPAEVPGFMKTPVALDALEYYGPEPDNWKSRAEPELDVTGSAEHFIDLEWADLIGAPLPRNRYDFIRALTYAQKAHAEVPMTPEKIGLLPYAANEAYERLKATMRDYRTALKDEKSARDVKPLEGEILFLAGVLGHWVGDGSQPLHTTIQYNGWTGANPQGYSTLHNVHAEFESDFVKANVIPEKDVAPLIAPGAMVIDDVFEQYVSYLRRSGAQTEELYRLEKAGAFTGAGSAAGKAFVDARLAAGATELRDVIYTAWVKSADPVPAYRNSQKVTQGQ